MSISAYVGMNGSGKSLAIMEQQVLPAWRRGRLVVSNMTLRPEALGFPPDLYQPLRSTAEIPDLGTCDKKNCAAALASGEACEPGTCPHSTTAGRACLVVFDEISACFPSRSFSTLPPEVARKLNQLRKADVTLAWSAPSWRRCDTILRECTITVTLCRGRWADRYERQTEKPGRFPRAVRDERGRRVRFDGDWLPHRVFLWRTFDAEQFEEFSTDKVTRDQLRPISKRWYWRTRHAAHLGYDTLEGVDLLDHVDDYGVCMKCRGTRRRPVCSCNASPRRGPQAPSRAPEGTGAPPGHLHRTTEERRAS